MTLYVVVYLAYSCGAMSILIPNRIKSVVCEPEMKMETTSFRMVAENRIEELGPSVPSGLFRVVGTRPESIKFIWEKNLRFR